MTALLRENDKLRETVDRLEGSSAMTAFFLEAIKSVRELISRVAPTNAPVLILGKRELERSWWQGPFTVAARGPRNHLWPSIALLYHQAFWKRKSLRVTNQVRSREQNAAARDCSKPHMKERFFSMKLAKCPMKQTSRSFCVS